MATIGHWPIKCMWPSQVTNGCEHDGAIELCDKPACYFVEGYSYCQEHTKMFVQSNIDANEAALNATPPISEEDEELPWNLS